MNSISELQHKVKHSHQLRIANYGDGSDEELVNMSSYSGVVEYYPEELVITLKAGTVIKESQQRAC